MQGKGYAAEAAEKVKDYAFNILKVKTLISYIDPKMNLLKDWQYDWEPFMKKILSFLISDCIMFTGIMNKIYKVG